MTPIQTIEITQLPKSIERNRPRRTVYLYATAALEDQKAKAT